jgi:hypothetical protein
MRFLYIKNIGNIYIKCDSMILFIKSIKLKFPIKDKIICFFSDKPKKYEYELCNNIYSVEIERKAICVQTKRIVSKYDVIINEPDDEFKPRFWNLSCDRHNVIELREGNYNIYYDNILIFEYYGYTNKKNLSHNLIDSLKNFFKLYYFYGNITDDFEWSRDVPILLYVFNYYFERCCNSNSSG